jgi:hypothetical protein
MSIITVIFVLERKKEKKKWVEEGYGGDNIAVIGKNRAVVSDNDDDNDDVDNE